MHKTMEMPLVETQALCFNKSISLTLVFIYAILLTTIQYKTNRAEYSSTLRGSSPTLNNPVNGLRHIIFHHCNSGLYRLSGSTDSSFCRLGRFLFGCVRRCSHA